MVGMGAARIPWLRADMGGFNSRGSTDKESDGSGR